MSLLTLWFCHVVCCCLHGFCRPASGVGPLSPCTLPLRPRYAWTICNRRVSPSTFDFKHYCLANQVMSIITPSQVTTDCNVTRNSHKVSSTVLQQRTTRFCSNSRILQRARVTANILGEREVRTETFRPRAWSTSQEGGATKLLSCLDHEIFTNNIYVIFTYSNVLREHSNCNTFKNMKQFLQVSWK